MPITGNTEPGAESGQLDLQQQSSVQFSSSIPIKKRRFPIIQRSPSPEVKASDSDANDPKNKQESGTPDEKVSSNDEKNRASPGNSDLSKISAVTVKTEVVTPTNIELGQANPDFIASKPAAIPRCSLGSVDLRNKRLSNEKQTEPGIPERSTRAQTASVKQEIVSTQAETSPRLELSMSSMNVELSLGLKEPSVPIRSDKLDPTLLSLASSRENLALHGKSGNTTDNVSSGVSANRSNWDLNTTMDVWEGSTANAFAHQHGGSGNFGKSSKCCDAKLAFTTVGTMGLSLNKGKHVLENPKSNSLNASIQSGLLYKTDDLLRLKLAMPSRELIANMERPLSDKLVSTRVSPQVNLQSEQLTAMNVNRAVKSEPADDNSKCDISIGSCCSNSMGLSMLSSVKRELANNPSLETVLPGSASPGKLIGHRSMKSEAVESDQEAGKCKDTMLPESAARVMQHQDSCASSSALPVQPVLDNSCDSIYPNCSDLTNNGDSSNQSEHTFHSKESHDHSDKSDGQIAGMVSKPISQDVNQSALCTVGNSYVEAPDKSALPRIGEHTIESCQSGDVAANDEAKINIPAETHEDLFGSDSESQEMDIDEDNATNKEYEEYEDGEVREPFQHLAGENPVVEREKTQNFSQPVGYNSRSPQHHVPSGVKNTIAKKKYDEASSDMVKDRVSVSYETKSEDCTSRRVSDNMTELTVDEKSLCTASEKKVVEKNPGKEVSLNTSIKGSHGMNIALTDEAAAKTIKEVCSGENDSTLSKEEVWLNDHDAAKDSNNISNKTRIINLSRTCDVRTPTKTRPIMNRLPTSRSGKERYSDPDLDGDVQPRANRDDFYIGGSRKFVKDGVHDRTFRNSNSFMRGKGRMSGRFGSMRREWDSDHNFVSENYRGQTDYRAIRHKNPSVPNVDLDCNGYGVPPHDGTAMGSGRRKEMNDEFSSLRRTSLRRISPGDRDRMDARGIQMMHRIPRNMSPGHCLDDECSDMMGMRHDNKFMRHLSEDMMDPVYGRQQAVYDELDNQLLGGNRNFRNVYPRIGSKSPVRSRSPGPWLSPRRRSPNGPPETMYRMGRMRSPERGSFRDELMPRRRCSSSYRNVDSGRDHTNHRPTNSHHRSPPARGFPRNCRRSDMLDSQEMGEGSNEYMNNGPMHLNKFHGDRSLDDRRNFIERRGPPVRPFRPMYGGDNDDFQFHRNDGPPRPYRFCPPDVDNEFVERSGNMRGREFDGRVKHQPMLRRIRNIDEESIEQRGWHDDGYTDARMKRMRF